MRLLPTAASAVLITAMAVPLTWPPVLGAAVPNTAASPGSAGAAPPGAPSLDAAGIASTGIAPRPNTTAPAGLATSRAPVANDAGAPSPAISRVAPAGGFTWPLAPRPPVVRWFEPPASQRSAGHRGVDLRAAVNQPVLSSGAGVVAFSGVVAGRGVITVRHPAGLRTTYEPVDERMAAGTVVDRGARIGVVSTTSGHCVPLTCLHWGAISGAIYQDPLSLLGFGRPILLPLG